MERKMAGGNRPAVVLRADGGLLACGLLLYGFFGVICLIFAAVLRSWTMAAFSLLFFLPALGAGLWFSRWRASFFRDRAEVRTARTYPYAGMMSPGSSAAASPPYGAAGDVPPGGTGGAHPLRFPGRGAAGGAAVLSGDAGHPPPVSGLRRTHRPKI